MNNIFLDLLIRPGSFFSKKILEPVNLRIPALIVLVGAVVGAIQGYVMSGLYARLFSQGDMASMGLFLKSSVRHLDSWRFLSSGGWPCQLFCTSFPCSFRVVAH